VTPAAVPVAALHTWRADGHPAAPLLGAEAGDLPPAPGSPSPATLARTGARRRLEMPDATPSADGSGDAAQDRKVSVRRAEPVPTARAARVGQIRESSGAAGRGIFHIASIPGGGRRCRQPSSRLIKTHKREKE